MGATGGILPILPMVQDRFLPNEELNRDFSLVEIDTHGYITTFESCHSERSEEPREPPQSIQMRGISLEAGVLPFSDAHRRAGNLLARSISTKG